MAYVLECTAKELIVRPNTPLILDSKFTEECGEFEIVSEMILPGNIMRFTLNDFFFVSVKGEAVTGKVFRNQILLRGYVPLNASHAQALVSDKEMLRELKHKFWDDEGGLFTGKEHETFNFFGSQLSDGFRDHTLCLKYETFDLQNKDPRLITYEDEDLGWWENQDWALVFKKEFINRITA